MSTHGDFKTILLLPVAPLIWIDGMIARYRLALPLIIGAALAGKYLL